MRSAALSIEYLIDMLIIRRKGDTNWAKNKKKCNIITYLYILTAQKVFFKICEQLHPVTEKICSLIVSNCKISQNFRALCVMTRQPTEQTNSLIWIIS